MHTNFKYNSIFEFNDGVTSTIGCLNILQLNVWSIKSIRKMEIFRLFLASINIDLDVIMLGETWLNPEIEQLFNLNGFSGEFLSRPDRPGGGIAVFVSNRHTF